MSENRETRWPRADGQSLEPVAQLPDPQTGELLEPTPENAARVRVAAAQVIQAMRDHQAVCDSILADESRRQGTKTLHLDGGVTAVLTGGWTVVYDAVELQENLRSVGCPEERIDQLVTEVVTFKINRSVLRQLASANPDYDQAIGLAGREEERPWKATIK